MLELYLTIGMGIAVIQFFFIPIEIMFDEEVREKWLETKEHLGLIVLFLVGVFAFMIVPFVWPWTYYAVLKRNFG